MRGPIDVIDRLMLNQMIMLNKNCGETTPIAVRLPPADKKFTRLDSVFGSFGVLLNRIETGHQLGRIKRWR